MIAKNDSVFIFDSDPFFLLGSKSFELLTSKLVSQNYAIKKEVFKDIAHFFIIFAGDENFDSGK